MSSHPNRNKYQGHKNWNHWNVSLWINNDEGLYRMVLEYVQEARTDKVPMKVVALMVVELLADAGIAKTPDGAPYSVSTVLAAMRGM